jgi:hypothetical protein
MPLAMTISGRPPPPVCFARRNPLPPAPSEALAHSDPWPLSDRETDAFARLVPLLACGEESAIHVFSGAAIEGSRAGNKEHAFTAQALAAIADDEQRHEQRLAGWRSRLPDLIDRHTRQRARRFFAGLASDEPATHFLRIAALDSAVCLLLAPLAHQRTPLGNLPDVGATLNRICADEVGTCAWPAAVR